MLIFIQELFTEQWGKIIFLILDLQLIFSFVCLLYLELLDG